MTFRMICEHLHQSYNYNVYLQSNCILTFPRQANDYFITKYVV